MPKIPAFSISLSIVLAFSLLSAQQEAPKKKAKKPNPILAPVEDVEGLPRVLLIGDSISMGYTLPVRKMLSGKANVHRPRTNCGPTTNGLANLDEWLATGGAGKTWDLIHFNWGLHDLKFMGPNGENLADPNDPTSSRQVPPEEYRENLQKLVDRLQETGAKLVWRNTTPVPEGSAGRIPGDAEKYNLIASEIMKAESVPTHDLYTFSMERLSEIQREANVHFTNEGSEALAEDVVRVIEETLAK